MKLLIIILLIVILLVLHSRYKKLEKIILAALNKNKFKLPNEIILNTQNLNATQIADANTWFANKGYSLRRIFTLPGVVQLNLFSRPGNTGGLLLDLLTKGEDAESAPDEAVIDLDGVQYGDIENDFLVLFPEQTISLPSGAGLFKKCQPQVVSRPTNDPQMNSNDYEDSSDSKMQRSKRKKFDQKRTNINPCLKIGQTNFKEDSDGPSLTFNQPATADEIQIGLIDSKANFSAFSEFEKVAAPHDIYLGYLADPSNDFTGLQLGTNDEHGTFMASIMANQYAGSKTMKIRNYPFHDGNTGHLMELIAGIYSAIQADVDIINLSLGYQSDASHPLLNEAIKAAGSKDILIVCAAGNFNSNNDVNPYWPANFSGLSHVITVAAVTSTGSAWKPSATEGTNFGNLRVNLATDGDRVEGFIDGSTEKLLSGTSCATAVLSTIAAEVKSNNPAMTAKELKLALLAEIDAGGGIFSVPNISA